MPIQDIIFSTGSMFFIIALLPTVFSDTKPALATSLITGFILAVFSATYQTLDLQYASITTATTAAIWFLIAVQTIIMKRSRRSDQK